MRTGRPKMSITLSKAETEQLNSIANSRSLPYGLVNRARIVLMVAQGIPNCTIAEKVVSPQMVCKWRQCYLQQGLSGLHDELRSGRPRSISDEKVAMVIRKTLQTKPHDGTHWTIRSVSIGLPNRMLDDYYDEQGWDITLGIPTKNTLMKLGVDTHGHSPWHFAIQALLDTLWVISHSPMVRPVELCLRVIGGSIGRIVISPIYVRFIR